MRSSVALLFPFVGLTFGSFGGFSRTMYCDDVAVVNVATAPVSPGAPEARASSARIGTKRAFR